MKASRILYVDDEPDIREIVDMSLGPSADFEVHCCASGVEALGIAAAWSPFLIMLDVMMPGMDGPTTLAQLRKTPATAKIAVLFTTAGAQIREIEHFISLGAQGVISKPFDPMTLSFLVRDHLRAVRLGTMPGAFMRRAKADAHALQPLRSAVAKNADPIAMKRVRDITHVLAGAAGLFGFDRIGSGAATLEDTVPDALGGGGTQGDVAHALDRLVASLERAWMTPLVAAVA